MCFATLFLCSRSLRRTGDHHTKGHSNMTYGRKENRHLASGISCLFPCLRPRSSSGGCSSSRPTVQLHGSIPYATVTVRRPRRLRKRRPNTYDNKPMSSNFRHSILDISEDKKGVWGWDSCSTIEPVVEIFDHKDSNSDLEMDDESNSVLPEFFDGHVYENDVYGFDFLLPSRLSRFVPHILETIEEAEVECPSIRERAEGVRRSCIYVV